MTGPGIDRLLREAAGRLAEAGVPSPRVDAEQLLAHCLQVEVGEVRRLAVLGREIDPDAAAPFEELVERRAARVPLQHLTGLADFAGLRLQVGPGVFVPRPETEALLGLARADLDLMHRAAGGRSLLVVDLCTGSGAIALALAAAVPSATVHGVELSPAAFAWAQRNAAAAEHPVQLHRGDARTALPELVGTVDLVASNPPYIPPGAVPTDVEVRDHDPVEALFGLGPDGLEVPRGVAARAAALLRPGGVLLMEHADVQGASVQQLLTDQGFWREVVDHPDLTGRPRVVRAVRAG